MDEKTLEQRTHAIFYLLSHEDPRFPSINFFCDFVNHTKALLSKTPSSEVSKDAINTAMKAAVHEFVVTHENSWKEIAGEWFPSDIFEALKMSAEYTMGKGV